ncbi:MAG: hypothetical protein ACM3NQ_04220 [Bacteroidales bacterium]
MKGARFLVAAVLACALLLMPVAASAQLIDRVLAVVGTVVITQSDAEAALLFGLVRPPAPGQDPLRTTLDQLIRREVVLSEVNRAAAAEVSAASVDKGMAQIRSRFASEGEFRAALARTAMTVERLHGMVADDLRIEEYEQQRFGTVVTPSETEVADYYASHQADFTEGGRPLTFEQAQPLVRQRLEAARRAVVLAEWVARLRRRVDVVDVYFADTSRAPK